MGMTAREREREGQVLPAYSLKTAVYAYLNGSHSISLSLTAESAPALGAPVSPHHNVSLQGSPNGLEQILQILPSVWKWQPWTITCSAHEQSLVHPSSCSSGSL